MSSVTTYGADANWLVDITKKLIAVDSTVGYYCEIEPVMSSLVATWGYEMDWDHKHTGYVHIAGQSHERCVCLAAHLDTIGFVVRGCNDDGTLRIRKLGGINWASAGGECVRIHCREGATVLGQLIHNHHSVHVWGDAKEAPRDEDHMAISVIGDVTCPDDARALSITPGAIVSVDPHFESFDTGFLVSRHIDDKGCVAALLGCLKRLHDDHIVPACDVCMAFPIYEEMVMEVHLCRLTSRSISRLISPLSGLTTMPMSIAWA